jgi:choloylglycine hydrolase
MSWNPVPPEMCTSFIIKARDGSPLYGRTMEWGGFDLNSELVLAPRGTSFTSALSGGKQGMTWKNQFGFIAINAAKLPVAADGMNETGLTVGVLYLPGFAQYQDMVEGEEASSLNNTDLAADILGLFDNVEDIKAALPKLRVIHNEDIVKAFGAPVPIHWVIADETGSSIVVEYIDGQLHLHDNKIGVMTNSTGYDWHVLNLRNYSNLQAQDITGPREINGVNLAPFGVGSGMHGLPGDITPPSRFVRAVAYTQTLLPFPDADSGVPEVAHILHNFDIPIGLVREGMDKGKFMAGQTQWSVIGDIRNRRYYYWTEHNRRMRLVDLSKLDFGGSKVQAIPLDKVRHEDIEDRTQDFS